jgi:hypothetical protein
MSIITQYIIVKGQKPYEGATYRKLSSRMTKGNPNTLDFDEIAVKVAIEIPDQLFERPDFQAQITVPKEAVNQPIINTAVIENIQNIIQQNIGIEVRLEAIDKTSE